MTGAATSSRKKKKKKTQEKKKAEYKAPLRILYECVKD